MLVAVLARLRSRHLFIKRSAACWSRDMQANGGNFSSPTSQPASTVVTFQMSKKRSSSTIRQHLQENYDTYEVITIDKHSRISELTRRHVTLKRLHRK